MSGNVLFPEESKSNQDKKPKRIHFVHTNKLYTNSKTNKTTKQHLGQNAVSRLMRDLKEWERCKKEFPCIEACPLDDNIMEWHCNICPDSGDFKNIVFHLIINFDETYPTLAPDVELCTPIPHPNVFGEWICLDMLKRDDSGKYKGWTAAYSVTSILMQLQSFLFEQKTIDQMDYDGSAERSFNQDSFRRNYLPQIKSFKCDKCKHCWDKPFPVTPTMIDRIGKEESDKCKDNEKTKNKNNKNDRKKRKRKKKSNRSNVNYGDDRDDDFCFWDGIYRDLEICIFEFFGVQDLLKLRRVAKRFQSLVFNTKIIQVKCCFFFGKFFSFFKTIFLSFFLCCVFSLVPINQKQTEG